MKSTVVTSLQNINRENLDGRNWDSYLEWFAKTLQINAPMMVYVDENLKEFVEQNRKGKSTYIISEKLSEIPLYHLKDKMDSIMSSEKYQGVISDPQRIECKSSLYNIIQYSKFKWVKKATEINPFGTKNFIWMDAGLSRFFEDLNIAKEYPGVNGSKILEDNPDRLLVQCFAHSYPDLFFAKKIDESYFLDNRSYVMGGMFAGNIASIQKIDKVVDEYLVNNMLNKGIINNEQILLGYLIKNIPDLFTVFINEYPHRQHRNYELIHLLGR